MTKLNHFLKPMLFLFSCQWCQRPLFKNIRFLENIRFHPNYKTNAVNFLQRHSCKPGATGVISGPWPQAKTVAPHASENCAPKESNRTDTIGVHMWSRPFCFGFSLHPGMWGQNIRTKRGFCASKRECVPSKESNRTDTIGVHLWSRPFCFVFSLHPEMWGQNPYQRFWCLQARMCPPKGKQHDQHHWGAFVMTFLCCF